MQNYYPTPVRYSLAGGEWDDRQWGARLAGILFMVIGGILLIQPLLASLGIAAQVAFGILGAAAFMTRTLSLPVALAMGTVLLLVGAGVVARIGPVYFIAMVLTFFMFMPSFPIGTLVGCGLLYVLWQGLPTRVPKKPRESEASAA